MADTFFEKNNFKRISPSDANTLDDLVQKINRINFEVITVVGHANPNETNPLSLSKARAESIKRHLIKLGIEASRIYTEGKGTDQPIALSNDPKNRRVEVVGLGTNRLRTLTPLPMLEPRITWRFLDDQVKRSYSLERDHLPDPWNRRERDQLPILDFIETIGDPIWRELYAHKLLIEAIWRKDDELTQKAFKERQIAQSVLAWKKQTPHSLYYPIAGFEASAYGTPYAKNLTKIEFLKYSGINQSKQDYFNKVACSQPVYGFKNDDNIIGAGQALFPSVTFMPKFAPSDQLAILNCALKGYPKAFDWLIEQGGEPDLTSTLGQTMLHLDILHNGAKNLDRLLKSKASPNANDAKGNTLLHVVNQAADNSLSMIPPIPLPKPQKQKIWDTLIGAGANPNIPNKAGQLPIKP